MSPLDDRVAALAARHRPLAARILAEAIRIPADYVDRPLDDGGDPLCGLSNHEGPRMEYLRRAVVETGAVRRPADVDFDAYGNLVWSVQDDGDGIPPREKRVVYMDGHVDTVKALRPQWREKTNDGIDAYDGLADLVRVDRQVLRGLLGYLPPDGEWEHLLFGRGSADQLAGVVAQIVATRILLELTPEGALRGVIVRSYATAAEEDNDGGGPLHLMGHVLPGAPPELVPDVVILTEGTGDSAKGALGIYRGQRGRMQIEVVVSGRSCHGSMPWEGLNPLEHGGAIVAEAARRYDAREGFLDHPFLGHGTRTASWAKLDTPSDCAVPERLTFRFDRRLTVGETPDGAVRDVEALDAVRAARAAGLQGRRHGAPLLRANLARLPRRTTRRSTAAGSRRRSTRRSTRPCRPTEGWCHRTSWSRREARAAARCAGSHVSTAGSSPPTASGSRYPSRTTRSPCRRPSAGSSRATSSTRRCSGSVPASSRTRTASASASTCASCSTRSPCSPASRASSRPPADSAGPAPQRLPFARSR